MNQTVEIKSASSFNKAKEITAYDLTYSTNFLWGTDVLLAVLASNLGTSDPTAFQTELQSLLANSICNTTTQHCTGDNLQYANNTACVDYLTTQVPLGKINQLGFDTVVCRMLHQDMVSLDPDLHCPHVGPTGGGYCTNNRDYQNYTTGSQAYYGGLLMGPR
ncbi:hypothetical protein MMC13_005784 [Lambiella insularis]|nr:hypothetical protein [Lambiella insularis]